MWKHLGKIRRLGYIRFLHFLLYVNSLKKFSEQNKMLIVLKSFLNKTEFNCFKNMFIFFILTASKIIKI